MSNINDSAFPVTSLSGPHSLFPTESNRMGWSIFNLSEWRLFEIVKYLIYLDCVAISTCAFLLYAEDNEVYKKAEDGGHLWLYNYLILGFNLAAPISIYFYTYDGYLYKIGLFVLFLFIAIVLRFTLASSFYFWHNIASFIGISLGGYLIFIIWYGKSEQTYRIPIHEFIGAKVTKQGSMVDRVTGSKIRSIGTSPESPSDARPRRSKSRSKSKSKSSRTSTSVTSPESAGGTNKATALFQKYFGPKKNKDDDVENKKVKSSDLGSRLFSPDTPPPKSKSRSKRSRGSRKSSEPQHSRQSSRRSHSGSRRRHSSRRSSSKHEDDDVNKDRPRRSNSRHGGGGGGESSRRSKKSSRSKSGKKPKT